MPRNQKDSQNREDEDERDDVGAPRVDEHDAPDEDDRVSSKRDDPGDDVSDDDVVEEIDLDDLSAMEGPDA